MADISRVADISPPPTRVRYLVLATLCTAAVMAYIHRNALAVPVERIRAELHIDSKDMGYILSSFYLGYALFQIPGGFLADLLGTRVALPLIAVAWSSALALMSLADGFYGLFVLHLFNGMAQAAIFPCCVKTFSHWFPESERAFPSGMLGGFMSVGGALSTAIAGALLGVMDWRAMFALLALPGLGFALAVYAWFRDRPEVHAWVNESERWQIAGARQSAPSAQVMEDPVARRMGLAGAPHSGLWRACLCSPALWLVCGQQFFRAAAYVFYGTWFPTFLQQARGASQSESGFLTSLPLLGVVAGSITGGVVMDQIFRITGRRNLSRKGMALVGVGGAAAFLGLAYCFPDPWTTLLFVVCSAFFAGTSGPAGYTVTIDLGGKQVATVFSIMNMAGNVGAMCLPVVVQEWIVAPHGWDAALIFLAGLYAAATVCWSLVVVRGPIIREEPK